MTGLDADRLTALLERLVTACEQVAAHFAAAGPASGRGGRSARPGGEAGAAEPGAAAGPQLPPEVGTARAAEVLGVSKDTVLLYREKGLLPYRDIAPPGSTKPIYMYPLDAVVKMRTAYQTDQPAPRQQKEQPRRRLKGERRYKHLDLD